MEPVIRSAQAADAAAIARVHVRSWQEAYRGIMADSLLAGLSVAKWTQDWQERLASTARITLVVEKAGVIQGWVALGPAHPRENAGEGGEIYGLYVAPESWSQSLGGKLLARAERMLLELGYRQISLWVVDANQRARRFYEKSGYGQDRSGREIERGGMPLNQLRYTKILGPVPAGD
jgi:ribosomal protein S18 acetylase RimI-like enzyme